MRKALWIKNGTLKLTGYILIPSLTEGYQGYEGNGDYAIGSNSQLWIADPNVSVYSTATSSTGFPEAPVGSSGVGSPSTVHQAISIYGKLRVTDGYLSTRHSAGIIFWNTANSNSAVIIEGGIVNASVMRSTYTADGRTSYLQTGGTVIVRGNETEAGEMNSGYPIFAIPNPNSSFVMSGGEIIIRDRNDGNGTNGNGLYLNCDPGNYSVTGGSITFETNPANTPSVDIKSKVALWNVYIKSMSGTGNSVVNMLTDLTVTRNLTVYSNATLTSGTGNFAVNAAGDFYINSGGTYDPNSNTTTFFGTDNYFLWNDGTITSGLYNLVVDKTEGGLILVSSGSSFTILNNLSILNGTLADGGKSVNVFGNVINNGTHMGAGKISLCSTTGAQTISGEGSGSFQNLELNNSSGTTGSAPISLLSNIVLTGTLTLANDRIFNISQYQIQMSSLALVQGTMSNSRFIRTSGAASDGGIQKTYSDTIAFVFPLGCGTNYMPASVHIRKIPTSYGSISVRPVPVRHPFATSATCMEAYWRVEESGFQGIKASSVRLILNYGNLPENMAYVPGKYNPAAWTYTNDVTLVNEALNTITFPGENNIVGDYTAGSPDAFGIVIAFYSRANGNWGVPSTWSNIGFEGSPASSVPGPSNPVFIGDGINYFHTVTVTAGSAQSGSLSLQEGSILVLGATTGNNFGVVLHGSRGKLRISSSVAMAVFPAGDFGAFLGPEGGIVEYYSGSNDFTIPVTSAAPTSRLIDTYYQLQLTPGTGYSVIMPNTDLTIYSDMVVQGSSGSAIAKLNSAAARTLKIRGNLQVTSGSLLFQNGTAQTLRIENDISVSTGAIFSIANSGTAVSHSITIGGNIINEGTFDMSLYSSGTIYRCTIMFTGFSDVAISGRGAVTDFYSLTVNKGTSNLPLLNMTSTNLSFTNNANPVSLLNGTLRLTSPVTVTISSNVFNVPATACLSANGGTFVLCTAASDDADLALDGMLEIRAGGITIGNSVNNNNNDIEYAGAGSPTIEVRGGTLFINGQVRRSLINGLGSLVFKQSGNSTVTINGRNSQTIRSKLEVLNVGSVFNMNGGTLSIIRGGSVIYNDLYLRPESYSVTSGTIVFGNATTENNGTSNKFSLDSAIPLNNLTVDGTSTPKTVTLAVHGLTLLGNLVIGATSVFQADSLDVEIAGNFSNLNADANSGINTGGFRPGSLRQVTTFNSKSLNQTITGVSGNVTNFANLVVENTKPGGSLTLQANSALRINKDLTMTQGIVADGGNTITVTGNISNSSVHTGTGRILLSSTKVQIISGNGLGKFGNLTLCSTSDSKMTMNTEVTGVLTFQTKMLDIGNNLLVLSNTGAGATTGTSSTSYIRTDGLVSDAGVKKYFPAGPLDYTYPVGVSGKYTPARMTVTANAAEGTITVIPVNSKHPSTTNAGDFQLLYYWHVTNTGFSGVTMNQTYTYLQGDVRGNENNYVAGRYYYGVWDLNTGSIDRTNNLIRFLGVGFIFGDYTAGYASEFTNVSIFYTRNATLGGAWDNLNTWSTESHNGPPATSYPNGQTAFIGSGHTVTTNGNSRRTFSLTLEGTGILDVGTTVGHDFGIVYGTGTIKLTPSNPWSFVFPAGDYTNFTSSSGGTVELYNATSAVECPPIRTYNKLIISGTGTKTMIDADVTINGTLTIQNGSTLTASLTGDMIVCENWVNYGTFNHNKGQIIFNGNTTISGNSPLTFNNIQINQGKSLTGPSMSTLGINGNWVNDGTFNHNSGTINFVGSTTISGLLTTTFNNVTISSRKILTGRLNDNIILVGNWVNSGTFNHNYGTVIIDGNVSVSGSSVTTFGNIVIDNGYSLTSPLSGSMGVALDFTNNGTFNSNLGTLIFSGENQNIGGSSGTQFENVTIRQGSTTNINADGQKIRGVLLCNGILNANSYLVLLSDQTQSALIDGSGTGNVVGSLTMQRYLESGFGYKYFSSPFRASTVSEFADDMDLNAPFPTFYRYDENRFYSGWVNYTNPGGLLVPMQGYAVNFGPNSSSKTVTVSGEVNNNTLLPATLFNRNRPFTKGFNLVGNPYPSPIDWNSAQGWVKTNIDNALYYFNAGGGDQYTGLYSTYVNGVSSDGKANNLIPSMQGLFIHVSNGIYPVAATLIFTNQVRRNILSPYYHKSTESETFPTLRLAAGFEENPGFEDPAVIYFEEGGTLAFDNMLDALKLMNTDTIVPNLYFISPDPEKLSINAISAPVDSMTTIPIGISIKKSRWVTFRVIDLVSMPEWIHAYLVDDYAGVWQNLMLHPEYQAYLEAGVIENRFSIVFSHFDLRPQPGNNEAFYMYCNRNRLFVYSNLENGEKADMMVVNMLGQTVYKQQICVMGYLELDLDIPSGIYVVFLQSQKGKQTKKILIRNDR